VGKKYWVGVVLVILYKLYLIGITSQQVQLTTVDMRPANAEGTRVRLSKQSKWSVDLLSRVKNNNPTVQMVRFVNAWQSAEGPAEGGAAFNPLNTTQDRPGATCFNADPCVKNYPSYEEGMRATLQTLAGDYPGYDRIVLGLHRNDVKMAFEGIKASPWGTHAQLIAEVYNEGRPLGDSVGEAGMVAGDIGDGSPSDRPYVGGNRKSVVTRSMTISTGFYAGPETSSVWGSIGQKNGMHWGVDFGCDQGAGCPGYMPFDCVAYDTGYYWDAATEGGYLQCTLLDGLVLYIGHMAAEPKVESGTLIPAGTLIGYTNNLAHFHVQLAPKGWYAPCAKEGTCLNFVQYYNSH
jgi:hypothetical protein